MFQSVIDSQEWRARRIGTGAGVSLLVHVGLVAAVMVISAGVAKPPPPEPPVVVFKQRAPRGTPTPTAPIKAAATPPKPRSTTPRRMTVPTRINPVPVPTTPPAPELPDETPQTPGIEDGDDDAPPCVTCTAIGNSLAQAAVPEPTGEDVIPFSFGTMTPPRLVAGSQLQYTREAREAHVSGLLIAKCVITREGEVDNCRIIKGVPHMGEAVLAALRTRRYTPVTYQGKPISVSYIFNIKLDMAQ